MDEKKPKIIAKTVEEFNSLINKVNTLPERVVSQIATVEKSLLGIECVFEQTFMSESTVFLPNNVTQIQDFDKYIGIYSEGFFFKIEGKMKEGKLKYLFI